MSIAELRARMSQNRQRIDVLEQECVVIKRNIERMLEEEKDFLSRKEKINNQIALMQQNASKIAAIENMRLAQQCGEDFTRVANGEQSQMAMESLGHIQNTFARRIQEEEEALEAKRREIERLRDDVDWCGREIARIEAEEREAARREAERRAQEQQALKPRGGRGGR